MKPRIPKVGLVLVLVAAVLAVGCEKKLGAVAQSQDRDVDDKSAEHAVIANTAERRGSLVALGQYCVSFTNGDASETQVIRLGFTDAEVEEPEKQLETMLSPYKITNVGLVGFGNGCSVTAAHHLFAMLPNFSQKSEDQRKKEFSMLLSAVEARRAKLAQAVDALRKAPQATIEVKKRNALQKAGKAVGDNARVVAKTVVTADNRVSEQLNRIAGVHRAAPFLGFNNAAADPQPWKYLFPICWFGACDGDDRDTNTKAGYYQHSGNIEQYTVQGRFSCAPVGAGVAGSCDLVGTSATSCEAAKDSMLRKARRVLDPCKHCADGETDDTVAWTGELEYVQGGSCEYIR